MREKTRKEKKKIFGRREMSRRRGITFLFDKVDFEKERRDRMIDYKLFSSTILIFFF